MTLTRSASLVPATLLALGLTLFHSTASHAQGRILPDSALSATLDSLSGMPLQLSEAVRHALANSTAVRAAQAAYLAARGAARREAGAFDPELFFQLNYLDDEQPTASFFAGAPTLLTTTTTTTSGLRLRLPTGTSFELALNTTRLETNSGFAFLNPEYDAFGYLSFRQPLLRGFTASGAKDYRQARRQRDAARARYEQAILAATAEVERAYWDLYATVRDYAVQILTVERGRALRRETELRAQAGLVGPNQVANARTFLAQQELLLLDLAEQLDAQSDRLASLIGVRPVSGHPRFIPVGDPPARFATAPVDSLVALAQRNNLDLRAAAQDVEAAEVLARAAGWELLPTVDVVGSVGGNGLAGSPQDVIFGDDTLRVERQGGLGDAISEVTGRDYPNWSIGVEVTIPIGFRQGRGERDRLKAEVLLSQERQRELSRLLEERVRATHRELTNGQARLDAAREGVDAAQEQVRTGLIEFHNGRTTAFELVRLAADLAAAQQRYSEALARTAKAAATLRELAADPDAVTATP
jgi:outer membrane protein TolC